MTNEELAKQMLEKLGGKDNVRSAKQLSDPLAGTGDGRCEDR